MLGNSAASALVSNVGDLSKTTWVVCRSEVQRNGVLVRDAYCPSLERLDVGDTVGVRRAADGTMHIHINGCDMGVAATSLPRVCHHCVVKFNDC